jgi:hypothetical protein
MKPVREVDLDYDVYSYIEYIMQQRGKPEMMESLRLIVEDIIVDLRMKQPERLSAVTSTDVLLALASQGLVEFDDVSPITAPSEPRPPCNYVWAATEHLIDYLGTGSYGIVKRTKRHRPKLRLDAALTERLEFRLRTLWAGCRSKQNKRLFKISMLLSAEKDCVAIPYKDDDGRLAWRASEDLLPT